MGERRQPRPPPGRRRIRRERHHQYSWYIERLHCRDPGRRQ